MRAGQLKPRSPSPAKVQGKAFVWFDVENFMSFIAGGYISPPHVYINIIHQFWGIFYTADILVPLNSICYPGGLRQDSDAKIKQGHTKKPLLSAKSHAIQCRNSF